MAERRGGGQQQPSEPSEFRPHDFEDVDLPSQLRAQPFRGRYRPPTGGGSVGHFKITAGTIACLVRKDRALYILSNNHVLANVNTGQAGDPVLQPGPYDGGRVPADVIAKLSQF